MMTVSYQPIAHVQSADRGYIGVVTWAFGCDTRSEVYPTIEQAEQAAKAIAGKYGHRIEVTRLIG